MTVHDLENRNVLDMLAGFEYIALTIMANHSLKISAASIILTGSFNPAIFQPEWFVRQNLLPGAEGEKAEIKIMIPQVTEFHTERFIIQVTPDRFAVLSQPEANPAPLRDLVVGTFFILEHTPLKALGLNRDMHFAMASEELWNRVGDTLVPKELWTGILPGHLGMRSLQVEGEIPDYPDPKQEKQKVVVRVEPSLSVQRGVYIQINEHCEKPEGSAADYLIERIRSRWEGAYNYAAKIAEHLLASTTNEDFERRRS